MADGTAISCQEVVEVITDYLEGKLSPEDVAILEAHLALCDGCRWYLDQLRITIAAVGRIEDEKVPTELPTPCSPRFATAACNARRRAQTESV